MTESKKRLILACAIGWFIGGHNWWEYTLACLGVIIFAVRLYLLDGDGRRKDTHN